MIPLFKPYMPADLPELNEILHSGNLAYGQWGVKFESELAKFVGIDSVLTTNSYNSAMLVLLSTFDLKPGDEIVASPMSCLASSQPFITQGLKVKWVDIDPATGTIDPEALKNVLTNKTKAIFHNHFCGIPGHIDEVNAIAKEHELLIIDDAIEAFGSEYKGKMMGNTGADATVFSFQTVRLPNTIDGGGLIFKNKLMEEKARCMRDYGINRQLFRNKIGEIDFNYDVILKGFGALPSEVNSYIGFEQIKYMNQLLAKQRENGVKWQQYLKKSDLEVISLSDRKDIIPNFWIYGLISRNKKKLIETFRQKGFWASGVHIDLGIYSIFPNSENLKGVKEFNETYFALPSGWWIDSQII